MPVPTRMGICIVLTIELSEIQALLSDPTKLVSKISDLAPDIPEQSVNFWPEQHKVVSDMQYRPDRNVDVTTGVKDANGDEIFRQETKPVHGIPSATQKLIIDWSVDLALSGGIDIDCTPRENVATDETMLAMVKKTLEDNKFDYLALEIERLKQRYLTVLLVWYSVPAEEDYWEGIGRKDSKYSMRCTILSPEDDNIIIPIRDQYKDMVGAARRYTVKIDGKDVEKMNLFLTDKYMTFKQDTGGWQLENSTLIKYGKANFILDEQKRTEWADVDAKIERVEEIDSDTADENQQSAFPILLARGNIVAATGGGASNTRKTFQMDAIMQI
ncbi:phage portal protein [Mucilaginibacter lacusdianchii]|uniref:phage portal protein n=1 Tax=Mucilaginibacter lacusdianchii TaxID=2684211 RepID=UPI00131C978D|nr:hypothetical protein [Mucilaginibacter sp. JXJ CY 39]